MYGCILLSFWNTELYDKQYIYVKHYTHKHYMIKKYEEHEEVTWPNLEVAYALSRMLHQKIPRVPFQT